MRFPSTEKMVALALKVMRESRHRNIALEEIMIAIVAGFMFAAVFLQ